jgi:arsenite methyltransferase
MKALTPIEPQRQDRVRQQVREHYGRIAEENSCGCSPSCCTPNGETSSRAGADAAAAASQRLGYSAEQTAAVPEGANLGVGCGNPLAIASLQPGQTVLDLGSGAGFDVFLAARAVGPEGKVIGVDMTPAMISKARANAVKAGLANTDFRLGEIENLPVADASVDVILSNCVINLSPCKSRVFAESWRVLKPGGSLAISDVVALKPVPQAMRDDAQLYSSCASGAALVADVEQMLRDAGFTDIRVQPKPESSAVIKECFPGKGLEELFASATIEAVKPTRG